MFFSLRKSGTRICRWANLLFSRKSLIIIFTLTLSIAVSIPINFVISSQGYPAISARGQIIYVNRFHSGLNYLKLRSGEYQSEIYVGAKIYYAVILGDHAILNDNGTLSTIYGYDHPDYGMDTAHLELLIDETFAGGRIPHLDIWIENWNELTQTHVDNFLAWLSSYIGPNRWLIFSPAREFNYGTDKWRLQPADYNRVMHYWYNAKHSQGITNILLASHVELAPQWDSVWDEGRFTEFLEGIRLSDIIGASAYCDDPRTSFQRAKLYYDLVNQTDKPFMFLEYGNFAGSTGALPAPNATFIAQSYQLLENNSFVKALMWWVPIEYSQTAGEVFVNSTNQYDGW